MLVAVPRLHRRYGFARSSVVQQRDDAAIDAASQQRPDRAARRSAATPPAPRPAIAPARRPRRQRVAHPVRGAWTRSTPATPSPTLPPTLRRRVIDDGDAGADARRRRRRADIVVGIPLPDDDGAYFEFFSLDDVDDTLSSVRLSLVFAARHHHAARRRCSACSPPAARVRPLGDAAQAAKAIAGGRLDTRLEPTDDPDLQRARQLVQRHGGGAADAGRARRPVRVRRQPRAALAADDARRRRSR